MYDPWTKEGKVRKELQTIIKHKGCNYYDTKKLLIAFFNRIAREYNHDTKIVEIKKINIKRDKHE